MVDIVLSADQVRVLASAPGRVRVRDGTGRCLGFLSLAPELTSEELVELRRRAESGETCYTTEEVLKHLHSLDDPS